MLDLNTLPLPELFSELTRDGCLDKMIDAALDEDARSPGDVTSASIIDASQSARALIVARHRGVIAGIEAARRVFHNHFNGEFVAQCQDGDVIEQSPATNQAGAQPSAAPGLPTYSLPVHNTAVIARIEGNLRQILKLERSALNLLGRLSGIATLTRQYVDAVRGTGAVICDTRKTTPGLRNLEKYAVRCGGGTLHRLGLFDAALYKDNHLAGIPLDQLAAKLTAAITSARSKHDLRFVEVEVDTLDQLREILSMQPGLVDMILLDNMTDDHLRQAVALRNTHSKIQNPKSKMPSPLLECSGGVTLERVRSIAETGVDRISVGAITHSAAWLDIGMDIQA